MKWAKAGPYLAVSDTQPPYKVAKFLDNGFAQYRASFKGDFLGEVTTVPKSAQAICARHHMINNEAKEAGHHVPDE